jgi:hypothetical protein
MSKDLHNIDDIFNSAYRRLEEDPSPGVWENINAGLDKKDAESYKKRFIGWKRAALFLLLLLTGFILYESGILKTDSTHSKENIQVATGTKKSGTPALPEDKYEATDQNDILAGKADQEKSNFVNKDVSNQEGNNSLTITQGVTTIRKVTDKKNDRQKTIAALRKVKAAGANDQMELNITPATPGKNIKGFLKDNEILSKRKTSFPLIEKFHTGEMASLLLNGIRKVQLAVTSDSLLKNNIAKKAKQKRNPFFKPFWMMTGFVSFDHAGYKLDSDEPSAVKSIKYREAHEPSFSGGILLTRQLTSRWGLQSGLIYSNSTIGMKPQKTYAFRDPTGDIAYKYITSSGYAYIKPGFGPQPVAGDSLTTAEAKHTIENITIPLAVKFTVSNKKISLTPGAGIEANFITKANLEVDIEDAFNREIVVVRKLSGTKSFYWSFVADAEIRYKVNKKLSISVRPFYRHAISPITENNVVETFPHSFGVGAGVTIKF